MKKKFLFIFVLYLIFIQIAIVPAQTISTHNANIEKKADLELIAESAILIDAKTGEILYEKDSYKKEYPASITKLMTILLALEYGKLDDVITFSKEAVFGIERNSSHIAIDVGEQITMEQGLYAIMLQSANEVSLGVAEHIDGTIDAFAKHMTQRAKELGCLDTNFVTPNGLHDPNHYTTAYDMALIAKEVLKFDKFREIMSTTYYVLPPTNKQPENRYLYGQHKMIKQNSKFYYEDCEGGKTGFTNQALNTLVSYSQRGETELIAVVLRDAGTGIYSDTIKLFDYGFENYETVQAFHADAFSKSVPVMQIFNDAYLDAGIVDLVAAEDVYVTLPKGTSKSVLSEKIICDDKLQTPIKKGTPVGTVEIYYNNKVAASTDIIAKSAVLGTSEDQLQIQLKKHKMTIIKTFVIFIIVAIIIIILIIAFIRFVLFERRQRKRRARFKMKYRSKV